jgi:hypothetical protein
MNKPILYPILAVLVLIDNNYKTAWVEGVQGDGIGEVVKLTFEKETEVWHIQLFNGYHKTFDLLKKTIK